MSEIRANSITNAAGTGAPDLPNGLAVADGTAAAPSITNTGDTDTGIYFPSANTVAVSTGGALRAYVDSGGLYVTGQLIDITGNLATLRLINNGGLSGYTLLEMTGNGTAQILVANDAFTTGELSFALGGNVRFRMGGAGQFGVAGGNYGTSGQVLTSGGSSAAPSWAAAPAPTTAQVGTATAGFAWGDLGSYAFLRNLTTAPVLAGGTVVASGSNLRSAGLSGVGAGTASMSSGNPSPTGTWRAMGNAEYNATGPVQSSTLWLRIA
jgi:hypothetical protein